MTDIYIKNASREQFIAGLIALFYKHAPIEASAFEIEMANRRAARINDMAITEIGQAQGSIPCWIYDAGIMLSEDKMFWHDVKNIETFYAMFKQAALPAMRKKSRSVIVDEIPGGSNAQS